MSKFKKGDFVVFNHQQQNKIGIILRTHKDDTYTVKPNGFPLDVKIELNQILNKI